MISERPAEVEDRAVPGHWEGDLLMGKRQTAIGTSGGTPHPLPDAVPAPRRSTPLEAVTGCSRPTPIQQLPSHLWKSLTWDQGKEMAQHVQFSVDTGVQVYFCDPRSPWQHGSNENTNGLLRQYFPKGTDMSSPHPNGISTSKLHRSLNRTASTNPRMDDTLRETRRSRCNDPLRPQPLWAFCRPLWSRR